MKAIRTDIPVGRENAVSRKTLAKRWHTDERGVRYILAELRTQIDENGYAILSTARSPCGYWRSNDPEEIRHFITETYERTRNVMLSLRDARCALRTISGRRFSSDHRH